MNILHPNRFHALEEKHGREATAGNLVDDVFSVSFTPIA
jgi:hypothetical protein